MLDGADYNRRTTNYNNIIISLKDIIQFKIVESRPQILMNLCNKLSYFLFDSFEKATFENESKQIKHILEQIQQEYFNYEPINK